MAEKQLTIPLVSRQAFRMVFCSVITPREVKLPNGRKGLSRYQAVFAIPRDNPIVEAGYPDDEEHKSIFRNTLTLVRGQWPGLFAEAQQAAKANGGVSVSGLITHLAGGIRFPFESVRMFNRKRAEKGKKPLSDDFDDDMILFTAKATDERPPNLGTVKTGKGIAYDNEDRKAHAREFYAGAEAYFQTAFAAYPVDGRNFVTAYLNRVYVNGKGERLGGGGEEIFNAYLGNVTQDNPFGDDAAF